MSTAAATNSWHRADMARRRRAWLRVDLDTNKWSFPVRVAAGSGRSMDFYRKPPGGVRDKFHQTNGVGLDLLFNVITVQMQDD